MSFDAWTMAFAERFLSERTFTLIVEPAIADLQFEDGGGWRRRASIRLAVLKAVAGGVRDDVARDSRRFLGLMLVPAGYYIFLMVICFDVYALSISTDFVIVATLILMLSCAPVLACFWPERRSPRPVD